MINNITLVGRLVKDIELRYFESGTAFAGFTIAVPRDYKNSEGIYETDFLDIHTIGKVAELTSEHCKKGDVIGIKGRLEKRSWTDKEDKKHYETYVKADRISFLSSKEKQSEEQTKSEYENASIKTETKGLDSLGIEIKDSDLPF